MYEIGTHFCALLPVDLGLAAPRQQKRFGVGVLIKKS